MYEIEWYMQNSVVLYAIVETFKHSGLHWLRDNVPKASSVYPLLIHGIVFIAGVTVCVVSDADALISLEVEGFDPMVGYVIGGILIAGGSKFTDWIIAQRKKSPELFKIVMEYMKGNFNAPAE